MEGEAAGIEIEVVFLFNSARGRSGEASCHRHHSEHTAEIG